MAQMLLGTAKFDCHWGRRKITLVKRLWLQLKPAKWPSWSNDQPLSMTVLSLSWVCLFSVGKTTPIQTLVLWSTQLVGTPFPAPSCLHELSTVITKASFSFCDWQIGLYMLCHPSQHCYYHCDCVSFVKSLGRVYWFVLTHIYKTLRCLWNLVCEVQCVLTPHSDTWSGDLPVIRPPFVQSQCWSYKQVLTVLDNAATWHDA